MSKIFLDNIKKVKDLSSEDCIEDPPGLGSGSGSDGNKVVKDEYCSGEFKSKSDETVSIYAR